MCAVYVGQAVLAELRRIIEESEIIRCADPRRRHLTATLATATPACAPGRRPARPAAQRDPQQVRLTRTDARAARTQGG